MKVPFSTLIQADESLTSTIRRTLNIVGRFPAAILSGDVDWPRVTNFATAREIERWADLTDQDPAALASGTFRRYAIAIPIFSAILDRRMTMPAAARQTWLWPGTTQACSYCLREGDVAWKLAWRLPWTFMCTTHHRLLETSCPRCRRLFYEHHRCPRQYSAADDWVESPALKPVVPLEQKAAAARIDAALSGSTVNVHGVTPVEPDIYLDTVRSLAGLFFHIHHHNNGSSRAPRRAVAAAPRPAHERARLIGSATALLDMPQPIAVERLTDDLAGIDPPEGLRAWVKDHSRATDLMTPLLETIVQGRASLGRRRTSRLLVDYRYIPQLIWPDVWSAISHMFDTSEPTGRAFAAMILVKTQQGFTWSNAGDELDLPQPLASNIVRVSTRGLKTSATELLEDLTRRSARAMSEHVDYGQMRRRAQANLFAPDALSELRTHLRAPHLRDQLLRERIWTQWALAHPVLCTSSTDTRLERRRAATQRQRWTPAMTERLKTWCEATSIS